MNIPTDLHYTKDHEWVRVNGEEILIGITDYAQGELGDIVFIELPEVGATVISSEAFGTIEAVKAAADMYSPITGEIIAVNGLLDDSPELINQDPYGECWILRIRISDIEEIKTLLEADEYRKLIDEDA